MSAAKSSLAPGKEGTETQGHTLETTAAGRSLENHLMLCYTPCHLFADEGIGAWSCKPGERRAGAKTWRQEKADGFVKGRRARIGKCVEMRPEGWAGPGSAGALVSHGKTLSRGMVSFTKDIG